MPPEKFNSVLLKDLPDSLRVRACIEGVPLTCSPREIADSDTQHWSDNLRTDHFSNARAARICAPLIGGLEFKFPATRLFLDGSYLRPGPNSNHSPATL